jgi:hypothetical protein
MLKHYRTSIVGLTRRIFAGSAIVSASLLLTVMAGGASAGNLYIGNDTSSPVTVYTTSGTFVQNFGQNGATGTALDAAGHVWTVAPNFGANAFVEYDSSQTVLNSFTAAVGGQWIEDLSHGAGSTIWAGTFEGSVFAINDQTGATISSFAVPNSTFTGVAFDGTNLWVSGGFTTDALYEYTTAGALLNTISLSNVCGGVGYDAASATLYCGDSGKVWHYTTAGALLGSFTTTASNYHDGLEAVNLIASSGVPEPGTISMMGFGLLALFGGVVRGRKK